LVSSGYKVAVVRQTEVAAIKALSESKSKTFTRDVDAIFTPATLVGSGMLIFL